MAKAKKGGLGGGVNALFSPGDMSKFASSVNEKGELVVSIPVELIKANPNQPRRTFDEESIDALAVSIQKVGLLQPISVSEEDHGYILVAGERRLRAAKKLALPTIKAIVVNADERLIAELALIENIQREDLNPVDEANAYRALIDAHGLTHEQISEITGKSRAHISNYIRLLGLRAPELEALRDGSISVGQAKVLMSVKDEALRKQIFAACEQDQISVREAELMAAPRKGAKGAKAQRAKQKLAAKADPIVRDLTARLEDALGTKVAIRQNSDSTGTIGIEYYSKEDRERLLELLLRADE